MKLSVDIEKRLGDFHLRASFTAEEETLALLGASGCGKSVTLRCIAGILTPDRGRITLGDRVLFDSAAGVNLRPQQRQVGYLFQQYALFPNMTAAQNIRCAVPAKGAERDRLTAEYLRSFHLEGLGGHYPAQLSGGQQQRVALARILASRPQAILLDEPFSALDEYLKWNLETELTDLLSGFSGPILWVSHDPEECCRNCRRVCILEAGRTGRVASMEEMLLHPETAGAARLAGCRNFVPAVSDGTCLTVPAWSVTLPRRVPAGQWTLGVPAGAIRLGEGPLRGTVERVRRDMRHAALLVRLAGAERDAPPLWAELPAPADIPPGAETALSLDPERVWVLPG